MTGEVLAICYVLFLVAVFVFALNRDREDKRRQEREEAERAARPSRAMHPLKDAVRRNVYPGYVQPPKAAPRPQPQQPPHPSSIAGEEEAMWVRAFEVHGNGKWAQFDGWKQWMISQNIKATDLVSREISDTESRTHGNI